MREQDQDYVKHILYSYFVRIQSVNLKTGEVMTIKEADEEYAGFFASSPELVDISDSDVNQKRITAEQVATWDGQRILQAFHHLVGVGRRNFNYRLRFLNQGRYQWMNMHVNIPENYSEEEHPWVLLFWTLVENTVNTYEDAMYMLERSFCRIVKVNLTDDTYENIRSDDAEQTFMEPHFSGSIRRFVQDGNVYEDDVARFKQVMNVDWLRDQFHAGSEAVYYDFRRKIAGQFRWCTLEVLPSLEYLDDNQVVVMFVRDIHEQKSEALAQQKKMEYYTYVDVLTELVNRAGYDVVCNQYEECLNRHSVGVIFADINGLKYVNDNYGHKKGDEYLRMFADQLKLFYGTENCFRISGDEFIVVLQYLTKEHFMAEFGKIRQFLDEQPSPMAAVGSAWQEQPKKIEVVERLAEQSMYRDKQYYYQKYHNIAIEGRCDESQVDFDVEQVLLRHVSDVKDHDENELNKAGLSSRIFDVFASTAKRGYLFLCNMQTNVSRWSRRAVEDFDLPGEYMFDAGVIWEQHIHPDDRAMYEKSMEEIFSGKITCQNLTYRAKNRAGEYVICTCESRMIKGEGDEPDYFAGTITNYGILDSVDNITHLSSKAAFLTRLEEMTEEDSLATVMMVVIDQLSSINTLYGYRFGDEVLRAFGADLQKLVGTRGQVYHMDTAMFGICMYDMDREQTKALYASIQTMASRGGEVQGRRVTIKTLGSAVIFGYAKGEADCITSNLGFAIGQSKAAYHGELVFYNMEKHKHEFGNRDMMGVIYQQIMTDFAGFELYYQPIVDARCDRIVGGEALVRWHDEKFGFVPPNRFIPFIEQNPCIFELGNWIIRRALTDAMEMKKYIPDFTINVNIAAPQLERKEFRQEVLNALRDTGYPPQDLCLELTERCRNLDTEFLRQEIEFFREQGIRIAMDDFGTGNASLQLILELPLDEIKIDRSFIQGILDQQINQVLVSSIVLGAKTIQAEICIEGIEDQDLGQYLQQFNPNYYQGYYYSKPVEKDAFLSLISE